MPTKAEIEEELRIAKSQIAAMEEDHESRMQQIGARAMELAMEHDLCAEILQVLEELDIPVAGNKVTFDVTYRVTAESSKIYEDNDEWQRDIEASIQFFDPHGVGIELDENYRNAQFVTEGWAVKREIRVVSVE